VTRSELALAFRIALLSLLAPDRRCSGCGRFHVIEDLEIDHADGDQLRAMCKSCNSADGNRRWHGRARYGAKYR
jgi:hypothetical protein